MVLRKYYGNIVLVTIVIVANYKCYCDDCLLSGYLDDYCYYHNHYYYYYYYFT